MRKCIYKTRPDFHSPSAKSSVAGGSLQVVLAVRVRVRLFATLQRRPLGVFLEETQSLGVLRFTLSALCPPPALQRPPTPAVETSEKRKWQHTF